MTPQIIGSYGSGEYAICKIAENDSETAKQGVT